MGREVGIGALHDRAVDQQRRVQPDGDVLRELARSVLPDPPDGLEVAVDVRGEQVELLGVPDAADHRRLHGVGDGVVLHGPLPRLLLGLHGRTQGPCRGRLAVARRGAVPGQLGVDVVLRGLAQGHQAAEQVPAQVRVDGQAVHAGAAVEQAAQDGQLLG